VYINPLLTSFRDFPNIKIFAYADDLILIANSKEAMIKAIEAVTRFCQKNYLKINGKKS